MRIREIRFSAFLIAAGVVLMLYPFISNRVYENAARSEAGTYERKADSVSEEATEEMFAAARAYNNQIAAFKVTITDPFGEPVGENEADQYDDIFNMDDSGIMCFVEIPKINVCLPVYHGSGPDVLEKGAGHIQGTAFPTGDEGIRPVISAHTGLNKAKMFSDLTEMDEGDLFFLKVFGETFAYEICEIQVILPENISVLSAEAGRDLVTLMTCTPYGVNTHRLIVTGERVEYSEDMEERIGDEAESSRWMEAYREALGICAVVAAGIILLKIIFCRRSRKKEREQI